MTQALVPVTVAEPQAPAPDGLTDLQWRFVIAYVSRGTGNATAAAREAGYSPAAARQTGYALLQRPAIQHAIMQQTAAAIASAAPMAAKTMMSLALKAKSEFVRQQAASDLLDRGGFKPPDRHQVAVAGSISISIDLGE